MTSFAAKRIGILSGIGASAGAYLHSFLIAECQRRGAVKDSDFPEILHYSLSPQGTDASGISDPDMFLPQLLRGVRLLDTMGANIILVACNSAYAHLGSLIAGSHAIIFDMPRCVRSACAGKHTGVISSRSTRAAGIYSWAAQITEQEQVIVDNIIADTIAGTLSGRERMQLFQIIYSLQKQHVEITVLGCTELIVAMNGRKLLRVVDAGELSIQEILS